MVLLVCLMFVVCGHTYLLMKKIFPKPDDEAAYAGRAGCVARPTSTCRQCAVVLLLWAVC
jgi:hypothetical protein